MTNGASVLCRALEAHGVDTVFAVPGTQNLVLHEQLRRSRIRVVLSTHELAASFMAIGYYRASGRLAPLVTIPGPGFTYAVTGLAEARHDSAALLHLVGPATGADRRRRFQATDHLAIAAPVVKAVRRLETTDAVESVLSEAVAVALGGEPGPVVVEWAREALEGRAERGGCGTAVRTPAADPAEVEAVAGWLAAAARPLLYAGQGCVGAAEPLRALAERLGAPIVTTASGRGIVPEDHPLVLAHDIGCGGLEPLNRLLRRADAILAVGCRLAASSTADFALQLPHDRVVRVDASPEPPGCPVRRSLTATAEAFLPALLSSLPDERPVASAWRPAEIAQAVRQVRRHVWPEPAVHGADPPTAAAFFEALRAVLPREAIVVADSGTHQTLVRRHFDVLSARGLIFPSDFQSMGFGLPAAIGAKLAAPGRPVVAVLGDGGFTMSGLELLTAVREQVPITVVVFADECLNRVRLEQLSRFGRSASVQIRNPDFDAFARATGVRYFRCDGDAPEVLSDATRCGQAALVEVPVGDSMSVHLARVRGVAADTTRRAFGGLIAARRGSAPPGGGPGEPAR